MTPCFLSHAPHWSLVALVVVLAALTSGAGGTTRALLGRAVPARLLGPAFAFDAAMLEVCVVSAPFLVTAFTAFSSVGALIATGALTLSGALLVILLARRPEIAGAEQPAEEEQPAAEAGRTGPRPSLWRNRRFYFWLLVGFAFGYLIGTADVGALPLALSFGGGRLQASIMIAVLAGGSATAGLCYAWPRWPDGPSRPAAAGC